MKTCTVDMDGVAGSRDVGETAAMGFQEAIFSYGKDLDSVGILTAPAGMTCPREDLPIAVIFNSGLLHRSEPYRLHVAIARRLAGLGIQTLRVDLAGKGDSPDREGVANRESVAMDWANIRHELTRLFGKRTFALMGICSGADNAIKLGVADEQVIDLVLMDPICPTDAGFSKRKIFSKLKDPAFLRRLPQRAAQELSSFLKFETRQSEERQNLRDPPRPEELVGCMQQMVKRKGNILAFFTNDADSYYNIEGQMAASLAIEGLEKICREVWWPHVTHLYPVQQHRNLLVDTIEQWFAEKIVQGEDRARSR